MAPPVCLSIYLARVSSWISDASVGISVFVSLVLRFLTRCGASITDLESTSREKKFSNT